MQILSRKTFRFTCLCLLSLFSASLVARGESIAEDITLTALTDDGKSQAANWAWHGSQIAFLREVSNTQSQLMIMNADGTGEKAVSPIGNPFFAEWSWDGRRISYEFSNSRDRQSSGGVFIYDLDTGKTLKVSPPRPRHAFDPDDGPFWSPDDQHVVYQVLPGPPPAADEPDIRAFYRRIPRQIWVADTATGKYEQLLPDRGRANDQRWTFTSPPKICMELEVSAGGDGYDIATVLPGSKNLAFLTDIGAEEIRNHGPRSSPADDWIAYGSSLEMTQTERNESRMDLWIARSDGSEARNLTKASSLIVEEQFAAFGYDWSWDGKWILARGYRYNTEGDRISTYYLVDPINGGYKILKTSSPDKNGEYDMVRYVKWSYDSSKIVLLTSRMIVRNFGSPDPHYEKGRSILEIYDVKKGTFEQLLYFDHELDRKRILADDDRDELMDISWSPDSQSLLVTIAKIISQADKVYQPDIFRLDLPQRLISPQAAQHEGPVFGRSDASQSLIAAAGPSEPPAALALIDPPAKQSPAPGDEIVTQLVDIKHVKLEEALASLPFEYEAFFTTIPSRNQILFKGPIETLTELKADLALIDAEPPHILVDLLAVELSDEANRNLGLDWTYTEGRFGFFQPGGNAIRDLIPEYQIQGLDTYPGAGQSFYQGVGRLEPEFFIRLNSLVKDGQGTILANPRTVAMSGKESMIQIRKTLNYFFNEGFDTSGRPVVKKSDISSDTEGRITPTLLPSGRIHLIVDVSVGTFTFTQEAGLPELTSRKSTTEVTVADGESIVIGGLRTQEVTRATTKVPLLGNIPYLKSLFTHEEAKISNSVLTIFITPQKLRENNAAPEWDTINGKDHKLVPIMEDTTRAKAPPISLSGKEITNESIKTSGWFGKFMKKMGL